MFPSRKSFALLGKQFALNLAIRILPVNLLVQVMSSCLGGNPSADVQVGQSLELALCLQVSVNHVLKLSGKTGESRGVTRGFLWRAVSGRLACADAMDSNVPRSDFQGHRDVAWCTTGGKWRES